ncbi:MAG: outer membrane beta-barrel protein [Flavobacterium sp.]|nr:outer membrane beta-barrel protein [Flavobacterium sp.]
MKKIYFFMSLIPFFGLAQQKRDWLFGVELGSNTITSHNVVESKTSVQGGFVVEYYVGNHWSLIGKIKSFETGVSFFKHGTGGLFSSSETKALIFKGSVLSLPVSLKRKFKLVSKLKGNLKAGLAYNFETKSNYELAINVDTNNPKSFGSFTAGFGLEYVANTKTILYLDFETNQLGGYKGNDNRIILPRNYYTTNNLLSISIKHNFKK